MPTPEENAERVTRLEERAEKWVRLEERVLGLCAELGKVEGTVKESLDRGRRTMENLGERIGRDEAVNAAYRAEVQTTFKFFTDEVKEMRESIDALLIANKNGKGNGNGKLQAKFMPYSVAFDLLWKLMVAGAAASGIYRIFTFH